MDDEVYASFWDHIETLRSTFVRILCVVAVGTVLCFFNYEAIFALLKFPLRASEQNLVLLSPLEGFMAAMKISFWLGVFLTSPVWLFLLARFFLPAMHRHERRLLIPFLVSSVILITLGVIFSLTVTIPISNTYLAAFNQGIGTNLWSLSSYLDYTLFLVLANGIAFESAVVGIFAVHLGLVSATAFSSNRRMAILGAFIIGALLTPPDVLTQLMLAIPLIALYELLALYAKIKERRQPVKAADQLAD